MLEDDGQLGLGIDAYLARDWALNLEFAHYWPTSDLSDFEYNLLTFGIFYRF